MKRHILVPMLLLAGCPSLDLVEPYYAGGPKPKVTSLSVAEEYGNVGGQEVVITGRNFGEDPNQLMVQFGSANAEILSEVTDTEIRVKVPVGPMSGGKVDVVVATPTGYDRVKEAYDYNVGSTYANQRAFVQVNNFSGTGATAQLGMGIDGTAEAFSFYSGRYHAPSASFWGFTDVNGPDGEPQWKVEQPAVSKFPFGVDDLHESLGTKVVLVNEEKEGASTSITYCVTYNEKGEMNKPTRSTDGTCEAGATAYPEDHINFCTYEDAEGLPTNSYESDWPLTNDFFASRDGVVGVRLELRDEKKKTGEEFTTLASSLVLPEPVVFTGDLGFLDGEGWSTSKLEPCYTDDVAFSFSWAPSDAVLTPVVDKPGDGDVTGQTTFVQITVDLVPLGWFGINTPIKRAILTVPDEYKVGRDDLSHVEVPASVMDQFPTILTPGGGVGGGSVSVDTTLAYGYLFISAVRVTDYAIHSEKLGGDVVFSYTTGDIGLYSWTNPREGCD